MNARLSITARLRYLRVKISHYSLGLALLSVGATALSTASDFYVKSLPGSPLGPLLRMHAGHVEVNEEHHGGLFFWHYQNRHIAGKHRTVIWLNGGPGCSSMDGNLMEIGPYRVVEGGKLEYNEGSWDQFANLLFVDSPVGTGFSYVDSDAYLHELSEMADQFVEFLEAWFRIFPEYEQDDLYVAGESYAGQHIPYIARAVLDRNRGVVSSGVQWNLQGLLIGNGWISGEHQSTANLDFALSAGLLSPGSAEASRIEKQVERCRENLDSGERKHVDTPACEGILQSILRETRDQDAPTNKQCLNMYDVKLRDSYPSCGMNWPPDLADVTPYLRDPRVTSALHIDPSKKPQGWTECNGQVGQAFTARNSTPSYALLSGLLEVMPIVLFSGADDLICNHVGTERLIQSLEWNGGTGFPESAPLRDWTFDGDLAGGYRSARNLTYILFHNSSHMVPFDHPKRSRDMLDRFIGLEPKYRFPGSFIEGQDDASVSLTSTTHPTATSTSNLQSVTSSAAGKMSESETETEDEALQQVRWDAYYRSGEVALVFVILGAAFWGWYVLRERAKRAGYRRVARGGLEAAVIGSNATNGSGLQLDTLHRGTHQLDGEEAEYKDTGGSSSERGMD